jgi:hypothetical protein
VAAECPHEKAIGRPDREEAPARLGYSHMTEAITATPGIRGVDGRQLPEVNREDFGPMPEMRQKTGTAKAIANPTTTSGLVRTTSTL